MSEVLTEMILKSTITGMWSSVRSFLEVHRRFGETHCLHFKGQNVSQERNQHGISRIPKSAFLQNVGKFVPENTASHPNR